MVTYHGSQALVAIKTDNTVAFTDSDQAQSISHDFDGGLHYTRQLGSRSPYEVKEGHIGIRVSLTAFYETGNFSAAGESLLSLSMTSTEVWVAIFPEGDASPKILLNNVKFGEHSFGQDLDGETTITISGLAKSISES
jgi:hypothetical protein